MSRQADFDYYSCRVAEEMERGDQAVSPAVAAVHFELAYRYALLADQRAAGRPDLFLVSDYRDRDTILHRIASFADLRQSTRPASETDDGAVTDVRCNDVRPMQRSC